MELVSRSNRPNRRGLRPLSSIAPAIALALLASSTVPAWADVSIPTLSPPRGDSAVLATVAQWRMLQQSDGYPFASYASFMMAHPGWPGEANMRRAAERAVRPEADPPTLIVSYFRRNPPTTPAGHLRFAEALSAQGQRDEARLSARRAWTTGLLSAADEATLLSRFADAIQATDHDARMDRLLWQRATSAAARQLAYTGSARRTIFEARLAFLTKAPDAAARALAVEAMGRTDAGYLSDKAFWQNATLQMAAARSMLAAPRTLSAPPADPAKWLEVLLVNAKGAANDQQWSIAYNIARQATDAYPPGTVVRDRPFDERDDYTSLLWLAASTALNKLARPAEAIPVFEAYANAARSAQTRSKGLYWAGRAAEAAGQPPAATGYYGAAAQFLDQFHGQLAAERMGRPLMRPAMTGKLSVSAAERDSFERNSLVRAAVLLGQQGNWLEQTRFVRTIATSARTPVEKALATELGQRINRPDLRLLVGKSARDEADPDYLNAAFPQLTVPPEHQSSWTMIHAITRQESQFDREAISPVGARGLMQLMPGTARETASAAGVTYDFSALTTDTLYNMRLGSTYFSKMMGYYEGSYVLAVAAYNAGPGNVNKWLRANGDPRQPGVDVLQWIENIPLTETRNYVQRVLENAVVYDLLNPRGATIRSSAPLSAYLGKRQPG
jgi:soluble lytic murein transglycosylase